VTRSMWRTGVPRMATRPMPVQDAKPQSTYRRDAFCRNMRRRVRVGRPDETAGRAASIRSGRFPHVHSLAAGRRPATAFPFSTPNKSPAHWQKRTRACQLMLAWKPTRGRSPRRSGRPPHRQEADLASSKREQHSIANTPDHVAASGRRIFRHWRLFSME